MSLQKLNRELENLKLEHLRISYERDREDIITGIESCSKKHATRLKGISRKINQVTKTIGHIEILKREIGEQ